MAPVEKMAIVGEGRKGGVLVGRGRRWFRSRTMSNFSVESYSREHALVGGEVELHARLTTKKGLVIFQHERT